MEGAPRSLSTSAFLLFILLALARLVLLCNSTTMRRSDLFIVGKRFDRGVVKDNTLLGNRFDRELAFAAIIFIVIRFERGVDFTFLYCVAVSILDRVSTRISDIVDFLDVNWILFASESCRSTHITAIRICRFDYVDAAVVIVIGNGMRRLERSV